jgi:hypothetical protein
MRMKDASEAPVPCHSVADSISYFFYLRVAFDYDPGQLVISTLLTICRKKTIWIREPWFWVGEEKVPDEDEGRV